MLNMVCSITRMANAVRSAGMALPAALAETGSRPQADSPQLSAYGLVRGLAGERYGRQRGYDIAQVKALVFERDDSR